jgi:hypothetical protein
MSTKPTQAITLSGDDIHTVLTSLADVERMYAKMGFTGLADNAKNAYLTILNQKTQNQKTKRN